MNTVTWSALSHESLIGPPSELINIGDFSRGARDDTALFMPPTVLQQVAEGVDPTRREAILSECR